MKLSVAVCLYLLLSCDNAVQGFQQNVSFVCCTSSHRVDTQNFNKKSSLLKSSSSDDENDVEDVLAGKDWRTFRAKLVMGESKDETKEEGTTLSAAAADEMVMEDDEALFAALSGGSTSAQSSSSNNIEISDSFWAYDSGNIIEQGAVILGGIEQDFGFGLRQQYFHKAVMLVLEHSDTFTRGIILNRPSNKMLLEQCDDKNGNSIILKWPVFFGGDVQGLDSLVPEILCIHSLESPEADEVSKTVISKIKWTSLDKARDLVVSGHAQVSDFWVFCGYAGWAPGQLAGELDRQSWYMCATDSNTLLEELKRQSSNFEVRDAGIDVWSKLMTMIGRGDISTNSAGTFDDLMLKEWARENLLTNGEKSNYTSKSRLGALSTEDIKKTDPVDLLIKKATSKTYVRPGTLVRGSSKDRSPFLLSKQEFHKSIVLITMDDANLTVGVMLNRVSSKDVLMSITNKSTGFSKAASIPVRFGGDYALKGSPRALWINMKNIGKPLDEVNPGPIWKCTPDEATKAISSGDAVPEDFLVVSGVSVWTKGMKGNSRGMEGEVLAGNFEIIPENKVKNIWNILKQQQQLTVSNISKNMELSNRAWEAAGGACLQVDEVETVEYTPISGLGEGFDEDDDSVVYNSDMKVSTLSDDALRSWIATFLLGEPTL